MKLRKSCVKNILTCHKSSNYGMLCEKVAFQMI